ncbi:MAG TPA: dihydrolipoyl dehydrogenase [Rhodocyclaceae bacterium]|nr:dihydrolipoyl dehydrogenase [Rhodocyclaceae bacterium]
MSQIRSIVVPDIGDYHEVPVIEIACKVGDTVTAADTLITLESDKATLDVPAGVAGMIVELHVKPGDKVSMGSIIASLKVGAGETVAAAATAPSPPPPASATTAVSDDIDCELLVLGAGPGGYSAAFRAADLGMNTVLVERYATLGGVCLNVGCIPSKALLHLTAVIDEAAHLASAGIAFAAPTVDIDKMRAHKSAVVGKLTDGLAAMAKARKVQVVRGVGQFIDPHRLEVSSTGGERRTLRFKQCIIAVGSVAVHLPFLPDDPRIVDSTGALELRQTPQKMLVIGGGIIGLEMATVYSTLGARVDVVEMLDGLMLGVDRDLVKVWQQQNAWRFERIMLQTQTESVTAKDDGVWVKFSGVDAPLRYDMILQSVGRSANGLRIAADKAGVTVSERGLIPVDTQMRTNVSHIFAIGDVVGQPMLAHKAVHEAHVAAEAAAGQKSHFDAKVIPGVAYTQPEVAWVGVGEDEAKRNGRAVQIAKFPWAASGRALANGADYGFTKLVFDVQTHRIIGGSLIGPSAGDMIGEVALAIEMGADALDIGKTIHPHPTLGETIGLAAEVAHGGCTDLPPPRKK